MLNKQLSITKPSIQNIIYCDLTLSVLPVALVYCTSKILSLNPYSKKQGGGERDCVVMGEASHTNLNSISENVQFPRNIYWSKLTFLNRLYFFLGYTLYKSTGACF